MGNRVNIAVVKNQEWQLHYRRGSIPAIAWPVALSHLARNLYRFGYKMDLKPVRWLGTTRDGIARLMYVAKFHDTICVLHVFTKKSKQALKTDIDLAKKRYLEARDG